MNDSIMPRQYGKNQSLSFENSLAFDFIDQGRRGGSPFANNLIDFCRQKIGQRHLAVEGLALQSRLDIRRQLKDHAGLRFHLHGRKSHGHLRHQGTDDVFLDLRNLFGHPVVDGHFTDEALLSQPLVVQPTSLEPTLDVGFQLHLRFGI